MSNSKPHAVFEIVDEQLSEVQMALGTIETLTNHMQANFSGQLSDWEQRTRHAVGRSINCLTQEALRNMDSAVQRLMELD
ncbi:MAG: hypothetical protein F4206_15020 [Gammaproteobacteria bacterium]|nr:hypothetical protein [Gammaproteobacteria bacterium]